MAGTQSPLMFGFEPYTVPVQDIWHRYPEGFGKQFKLPSGKFDKEKREIIFDVDAKYFKKQPAADHYKTQKNWDKNFKFKRG